MTAPAKAMTGAEFAAIRKRLNLSLVEFGRALGYDGNRNTVQVAVSRYESGAREIPPWIARLAVMFDRHGVPADFADHDPGGGAKKHRGLPSGRLQRQ